MKKLFAANVALMFALVLASTLTFAAEKKEAPAKQAATKTETKAPAAKAELLDINTATEAELKALPGIGEAYSKKIIAGRPLKSIKSLADLGIPGPTIEKIKPLVTFSAPKKPPKKGMVWVNTATKVYHKRGSPWYGATKEGEWMTEAAAVKAGNKAASE